MAIESPSGAAPLRICYVIDEMEAISAGGTERQVLQMAQLARQSGFHVEIWMLRGTGWLTEAVAGCPVEHFQLLDWTRWSSWKEAARLIRRLRSKSFDILQTFFVEANIVGPLVGRLAGIPVILGSRRNLNYWMSDRTRILQRFSNLWVTRLLANCRAVAEAVSETESVALSKIDILYNGIDVNAFSSRTSRRNEIRGKLGLNDDQILIGNVSSLRPIKGTEAFLDAAARVCYQAAHARFVLIGDGPLRPALEAAIGQWGLADRFKLLGAQVEVADYLRTFDIAVLSTESEGFSNSLLEYMAAGLPCVATDVGGNREALADSAGILVAPERPQDLASAILSLIENSDYRYKLGTAARARALDFNLEKTRMKVMTYYQEVASSRAVRTAHRRSGERRTVSTAGLPG